MWLIKNGKLIIIVYQSTASFIKNTLEENNYQLYSSNSSKEYHDFSSRNASGRYRQDENSSSQYSPNAPLYNIKDNPIDCIEIDSYSN